MTSQTALTTRDVSLSVSTPVLNRRTLKEQFDISEELGFICEPPLTVLPEYFEPWSNIALNLPELIKQKRVREEVEKLPLLDHNRLRGKAEWEAAHLFLAYITQGYVWQEGDHGIPEVLPKAIAVPYHAASQYLQIPANFNQFNSVLVNWRIRDDGEEMYQECYQELWPSRSMLQGGFWAFRPNLRSLTVLSGIGSSEMNMDTILTLAGGREEQWFFLTAVMVEKECGAALYAIAGAQQAVYDRDDVELERALAVIEGAVMKMVKQFERTPDGLTPDVFYNVIRPFISGWSAPAFKKKGLDGLIYESVSDTPIAYPGGTAAESTTLPALDAALGISHKDSEEVLLKEFRQYMPPKHVQFVDAIYRGPSIRKYVELRGDSNVLATYNRCLEAVQLFRDTHLKIVTRFIVIPSRRGTREAANGVIGTGGTGFMDFLKGLRDSTIEAFLSRKPPDTTQTSPWPGYGTVLAAVAIGGAISAALYWKLGWNTSNGR